MAAKKATEKQKEKALATVEKEGRSRVVKMRADALRVHPYAQRAIVPTHLNRLIAEMDLDSIGVLHAVEYEIPGKGHHIWIIDGQHRWQALLEHGFGEWEVQVKIHTDVDSDKRSAELFLTLNRRANPSPYAKFKNMVTAQDPIAVGVTELVKKHGLRIMPNSGDGHVACTERMMKSYKLDSGKALDDALNMIVSAWGKVAAGLDGNIISGMSQIFLKHGADMDIDHLRTKLAKSGGGPSRLLGLARGQREYHRQNKNLPYYVAESILSLYNKGKRRDLLEV